MLSFPVFPGLSATQSLSLSTDGPISQQLWAEARAYDLANPLSIETLEIHRVTLKRSFGISLLAFHMRKAILSRGLLEERDIANLGLTPTQIAEWKQEALALVLSANPTLSEFAFQEAV